jgi:predicted transcriptional regulator
VVASLEARARTANAGRAHAEADRDEIKEDRQDQRVGRRLLDYLRRRGDWVNGAELRRALASRDRPAFESAVAKLVAAGVVESEPTQEDRSTGRPGFRYQAVEQ